MIEVLSNENRLSGTVLQHESHLYSITAQHNIRETFNAVVLPVPGVVNDKQWFAICPESRPLIETSTVLQYLNWTCDKPDGKS